MSTLFSTAPETDTPQYRTARRRYLDIIKGNPDAVAGLLKSLHETSHPDRSLFVLEIAAEFSRMVREGDLRRWDKYCSTGLMDVMWDIALDGRYHRADSELYILKDEAFLEYLTRVYAFLYSSCNILTGIPTSRFSTYRLMIELFLSCSQKLWDILWSPHMRSVLRTKCGVAEAIGRNGPRGTVIKLSNQIILLHCYYHPNTVYPPNTYITHVSLFCWIHHEDPEYGRGALVTAQFSVGSSFIYTFALDLGRQVVIETESIKPFLSRCAEGFKGIHGHKLQLYLSIPLMMTYQPSLRRGRTEAMIPRRLLDSMKRQLCSGSEQITSQVIAQGIYALSECINKSTFTKDAQIDYMVDCLPVISRAVKYGPECDTIARGIELLCQGGRSATGFIASVFEEFKYVDRVKRIIQVEWQPMLKELRAMSPARAPYRDQVINTWMYLGKMYRATSFTPTIVDITDLYPHRPVWKRCHWRDCVCHILGAGSAHPMRVCKGCWNSYYCCTKCQRRDWLEGGHKYDCKVSRLTLR